MEVNFDGLVGPTHSYGGLSFGNVASMGNRASVSNPREAVLQGLTKAKALHDMGFRQGILAPQERPDMRVLRRLGFYGSDEEMLAAAYKKAPDILEACSSASSMWTANAATVSPSVDSTDHRVHFTTANLNMSLHRAMETRTTTRLLRAIFPDKEYFAHHLALPHSGTMGDEGAANHTRFCRQYDEPGVQLFIYGYRALNAPEGSVKPAKYPARQTLEASQAVARLHRLDERRVLFWQQAPESIDTGAFHNDVVSVGNENVFFYHEQSFVDGDGLMSALRERVEAVCETEFVPVRVNAKDVPLRDAVKSYLFNSQLITLRPGHMMLVAPHECEETPTVARYLSELLAKGETPIREVKYFDLRQSMRNGGGPACLRLRVALKEREIARANQACFLNDKNFARLKQWAEKHYRDKLTAHDLADPSLLRECRTALDELTQILKLGSVYPFQLARI